MVMKQLKNKAGLLKWPSIGLMVLAIFALLFAGTNNGWQARAYSDFKPTATELGQCGVDQNLYRFDISASTGMGKVWITSGQNYIFGQKTADNGEIVTQFVCATPDEVASWDTWYCVNDKKDPLNPQDKCSKLLPIECYLENGVQVCPTSNITFEITWLDEDGTLLDKSEVTKDAMPSYGKPLPTKTKPGESCSFNKWTPDIVIATGNATYTATYTCTTINYLVSYSTTGCAAPAPIDNSEYTAGQEVTVLGQTVAPGYTFEGWWMNGDLATTYAATDTFAMPNGNVALTGRCNAVDYTVHYDPNGGTGGPANQTYNVGDTVTVSTNYPTRTGYTFQAWLRGGVQTDSAFTMPAENVTLVAQWQANQYEIIYHANTGTGTMANTPATYDSSVTLAKNLFTKPGYQFVGWSITADGMTAYTDEETFTYNVAGNLDLYAVWLADMTQTHPLTYLVQYYKDETVLLGTETVTKPLWVAADPQVIPVDPVDRDLYLPYGYKFNRTDPAAIPTTIANGGVIKVFYVPDYDQTNALIYTVEYYKDGTVFIDSDEFTDNVWVAAEQILTVQTVDINKYLPTGYTFDRTEPTPIPGTIADGGVIRVYYEINKYTITWVDYNGDELEVDRDVNHGTIPSYDSAAPTRPATAQYTYTFTGWSPTVVSVTGDATYTAQFSSTVRRYTVTFVDWDGRVIRTETVNYGANATAPANPTRPGYNFIGWDRGYSNITSNITVRALYNPVTTPPPYIPGPIITPVIPPTPTPEPEVTPPIRPIPAPRDQGEVLGVEDKQAWALLNLLLAIGTALASIILVIRYFVGKKEDDEKNENAKEADKIKRHGGLRAFSILVAAGAIIAFILTEDMTLPMIWVDMWTILMVAIAVVQIIVMIAARRRKANGKNDKKPLDTDQEDAKSTTKPNTTKSSIDFKLSYEG